MDTGVPNPMNNAGACATDLWMGGGYTGFDLNYQPPGATGGSCSSSATADPSTVSYAAHDTECTPDTPLCTGGGQCMPGLPASYSVCIEQSGDQGCPGNTFTQKHLVGTGASFGCSGGCNCALPTNITCTGTFTLYTNGNCTGSPYPLPVSSAGMCVAPTMSTKDNYNSYHYVPNALPTQSCTPTGSSNPTGLQLTNETTICCAP
jgi:hypothetical protein